MIAGSARGIRLDAPAGTAVRPTSDRVRESMFNALGSLDVVQDASVLDLFAGSGALAVEALSRGASSAVLIDNNRQSVTCARENLERCRLDHLAEVRHGDAAGALRRLAGSGEVFDLALLDPPYAFEGWRELLAQVPAAFVVVESNAPVAELIERLPDDGMHVDPLQRCDIVRQRSYGATVVTFLSVRTEGNTSPERGIE